ncbi:MAG TPA: hypothetical protein VNW53_15875 [Phenylobacterium sp.]|jgi:hypothetical protein|uniref:hypothetical protein n=1 Tax=Phenylobacterium sp. TaxID=1871053 RepID=UPI002B867139|nr:hypothetical protein [Phenylobacterium sp.]HXA40476.1 hypothetical protein [Phenylobacterium sp.]
MSSSRIYAERACHFSRLSDAARSDDERDSYRGIAAAFLERAKSEARRQTEAPGRRDRDEP